MCRAEDNSALSLPLLSSLPPINEYKQPVDFIENKRHEKKCYLVFFTRLQTVFRQKAVPVVIYIAPNPE